MAIERREPTHTLVIEIPVDMTGAEGKNFDPLQDALQVVLAVSRLAVDGVLADTPNVRLNGPLSTALLVQDAEDAAYKRGRERGRADMARYREALETIAEADSMTSSAQMRLTAREAIQRS